MSHLLSRLADRAMGLVPGIEPVRTPIFGGEPAASTEDTRYEPAGFHYGDIVGPTQAARSATTDPAVGSTDTPTHPIEVGDRTEPPARSAPNPLLHEPLTAVGDSRLKKGPDGRQQGQDFIKSSVRNTDRYDSGASLNAAPGPAASTLSPVTSQLSQSVDSDLPGDERNPAVTEVVTETSMAAVPRMPEAAEPGLRPKDFTGLSFSAQDIIDGLPHEARSTPAPLPTIKVSIGRIDVRAVTTAPASAPRQRKKNQPSLSLDDYLRQRSEGQR